MLFPIGARPYRLYDPITDDRPYHVRSRHGVASTTHS